MSCESVTKYSFGGVTKNFDNLRIPLSSREREKRKGPFPYYGAQGIIDSLDDFIFDGQYLLIAEDGENLKSKKQNIAQLVEGKFWVNNHAHIVKNNKLSDIRYLYYYINNVDILGYITGSAQPKLNQANLNKICVSLPHLLKQKKIADLLSSLDNKIKLNNQINANLEQQAQAIFKSWFIDFEPFNDGEFVESELGLIPKGWSVTILDELCSLIAKGITPKYKEKTGQYVIGQKCIRNNKIDLSIAQEHLSKTINEKWITFGDILINSTGTGTLGRTAQVYFIPQNVAVDSHVTIIRPKETHSIDYLGGFLCTKQALFESMASGSTGQTDLPRERLKAMNIIVPPSSIQLCFSKLVLPFKKQNILLQEESVKLANLRDILLPKLMNGEVNISSNG